VSRKVVVRVGTFNYLLAASSGIKEMVVPEGGREELGVG